jgi:hypothetical protein
MTRLVVLHRLSRWRTLCSPVKPFTFTNRADVTTWVAGYLTWQGWMTENNGVVPKFAIDLSRDALRDGRDTRLETDICVFLLINQQTVGAHSE